MKLIFWENIISHLRTPFFKVLAELPDIQVVLILDKELSEDRKKLGWTVDSLDGIEIIIAPSKNEVKTIVESSRQAHHFLSGINVYPVATMALKQLVKNNVRFSIFSEQFRKDGIKGSLRKIKSKFEYLNYRSYIKSIYAIGDDAVVWYKDSGYSLDIIHQWIYFSENFEIEPQVKDNTILFVGELSDRKNILHLVESFLSIDSRQGIKLKIIGNGNYKKQVEQYSKDFPSAIEYVGVLSTKEVRNEMAKSKVLVLPSLFDGWGAVVNEAILSGCYCITSDKCGSKTLFNHNSFLGESFDLNKSNGLTAVLEKTISSIDDIPSAKIREWAKINLNNQKAVQYFLETIKYQEKIEIIKPQAPWLN